MAKKRIKGINSIDFRGRKISDVVDLGSINTKPVNQRELVASLDKGVMETVGSDHFLKILTDEGELSARKPYIHYYFYLSTKGLSQFTPKNDEIIGFEDGTIILNGYGVEGTKYLIEFDLECKRHSPKLDVKVGNENDSYYIVSSIPGKTRKTVNMVITINMTGEYQIPLKVEKRQLSKGYNDWNLGWSLHSIKVDKI